MAGKEGNIIQRSVIGGVEATKPIEIGAIVGGVIFASEALVTGGVLGLVGGEMLKNAVKPKTGN